MQVLAKLGVSMYVMLSFMYIQDRVIGYVHALQASQQTLAALKLYTMSGTTLGCYCYKECITDVLVTLDIAHCKLIIH